MHAGRAHCHRREAGRGGIPSAWLQELPQVTSGASSSVTPRLLKTIPWA